MQRNKAAKEAEGEIGSGSRGPEPNPSKGLVLAESKHFV